MWGLGGKQPYVDLVSVRFSCSTRRHVGNRAGLAPPLLTFACLSVLCSSVCTPPLCVRVWRGHLWLPCLCWWWRGAAAAAVLVVVVLFLLLACFWWW